MRACEFLGGVFVGVVIGAALGLLLAPQSGEETREMLRKQAGELGERVGELGEKVKESSRQALEAGLEVVEKGKAKVASIVQEQLGGPQGEEAKGEA